MSKLHSYHLVTIYASQLVKNNQNILIPQTFPVRCLVGTPILYSKMLEALHKMHLDGWEYSLGAEREVSKPEFEDFMIVTGTGRNMFTFD